MHHVLITEYRVLPGKMQDLFQGVQHWEREARERPDAPETHSVLCGADDPSRVMIVTQFSDRDKAISFFEAGMLYVMPSYRPCRLSMIRIWFGASFISWTSSLRLPRRSPCICRVMAARRLP